MMTECVPGNRKTRESMRLLVLPQSVGSDDSHLGLGRSLTDPGGPLAHTSAGEGDKLPRLLIDLLAAHLGVPFSDEIRKPVVLAHEERV